MEYIFRPVIENILEISKKKVYDDGQNIREEIKTHTTASTGTEPNRKQSLGRTKMRREDVLKK